ncbi:MAG: helix-turn-helix transcriptional regulator [Bacteroidales bacterium]
MMMQKINYLPIEYIFNLAALCRKGWGEDPHGLRLSLQRRRLRSLENMPEKDPWPIPRVSFWIRLCQAAFLLDESATCYPTLLMEEWLAWPFFEQIAHLLAAWKRVPTNEKFRRIRAELIEHLQPHLEIKKSLRNELIGLQALGICTENRLSALGEAILKNKDKSLFSEAPIEGWKAENDQLLVPFPPKWDLLWQLEKYLDPEDLGCYSITPSALTFAAQRGAIENKPSLCEILTSGIGAAPPKLTIDSLLGEPMIHLIPGQVIEFRTPEDLKNLRNSPSMRNSLGHILSPRHVALDPWLGGQILKRLYQKGLLSENDFCMIQQVNLPPNSERPACDFSQSDRAYLLSILLLVAEVQRDFIPPPGLLNRLTCGMDHTLRATAAKRAQNLYEQIHPQPAWLPENAPSQTPPKGLVEDLQKAIDREEAINVLYQASGRHSAEPRHLTPLLIEQRRERYYLIAYCHTRRANRTFRLDRLELIA